MRKRSARKRRAEAGPPLVPDPREEIGGKEVDVGTLGLGFVGAGFAGIREIGGRRERDRASSSRWPVNPLTRPNQRAHHQTVTRISISFSVAQETISISIRPFRTWETWTEMVPLSLSQHNLWPPESVFTVFRGYATATSKHACDHLRRHLRLGFHIRSSLQVQANFLLLYFSPKV